MPVVAVFSRNYDAFIELDVKDLVGKWVAIYEGKVVSKGDDPKKTFKSAKEIAGPHKFFFARIPEAKAMIL